MNTNKDRIEKLELDLKRADEVKGDGGSRFGFQYTTSISGLSISIAHTLGRELGRYLAKTK